ncbi:PAXIP1 [Cordylochernes scorpioides]|uniref:PAX-interacting protein 1 n=1 Tax=Cordylochernes scorpioides TaxID=51811 RepID=A0ABY6JYD5_9ARAC|nr:PAXIP1 [Cordylochernes scorpioides]
MGVQVKQLLLEGGAKQSAYLTDIVTHLVADNPDSPDVNEAIELYEKPVITCSLNGFSPNAKQIFSGVTACPSQVGLEVCGVLALLTQVCICQLSKQDVKALWALVTYYGGKFQLDFTPKCSHVIANRPEGRKYEKALHHQVKVVTPDWVADSVRNKSRCDEDLYHPRLLILPKPPPPPEPPKPEIPPSLPRVSEAGQAHIAISAASNPELIRGVNALLLSRAGDSKLGQPTLAIVSSADGMTTQQQQIYLQALQQQQGASDQQQAATIRISTGVPQRWPVARPTLTLGQQQQILQIQYSRLLKQQQLVQQQIQNQQQVENPQPHVVGQLHQQYQAILQQLRQLQQQQVQLRQVLSQQQQQLTPQQQQQLRQQQQQRQLQLQQQQIQRQQQLQKQQQAAASPQQQSPLQQQQPSPLQQQSSPIQSNSQQPSPLSTPRQPSPAQQMSPLQQTQLQQQLKLQQATTPTSSQQYTLMQQAIARPQQKPFIQLPFATAQQPMHGQPPVQCISPQQQQQIMQLRNQQIAIIQRQKLQQLQKAQQQQGSPTLVQQTPTATLVPPAVAAAAAKLAGQSQVILKPPPQYPFPERGATAMQQLTGQPRLQYPAQPRVAFGPRLPWQLAQLQKQQQQQQQQAPRPRPTQSATIAWGASPTAGKEERLPGQIWQPRPDQQDPTAWQSSQQILQWQKLKQMEMQRRQQIMQQQQQTLHQQQGQFSPADGTPKLVIPASQAAQFQTPMVVTSQAPPNFVNPKTKTALANLLNYRLGGTGTRIGEEIAAGNLRLPLPTGQPTTLVALPDGTLQQGRRLSEEELQLLSSGSNVRIGTAPVAPAQAVGGTQLGTQGPVPGQVRRVDYVVGVPVPAEFCLLGCVFHIVEYDRTKSPEEIEEWKKSVALDCTVGQCVERVGGEVEATYSARCTHVVCETQRHPVVVQAIKENKRCITVYWLNDVILKKKHQAPWLAYHFPIPFVDDEKPCKDQMISTTHFEGDERERVKIMIRATGAKYTTYMSHHNTVLIARKNEGDKVAKAKDWKIPVVNVTWLQDVMLGHTNALQLVHSPKYRHFVTESNPEAQPVDLFKMDFTIVPHLIVVLGSSFFDPQPIEPFKMDNYLVPHLIGAWRTSVKINEEIWNVSLPGLTTDPDSPYCVAESQEEGQSGSKLRIPKQKAQVPVHMSSSPDCLAPTTTTGTRGILHDNHVRKIDNNFNGYKTVYGKNVHPTISAQAVTQLGGMVTTNPRDCTHIVMEKFVRTLRLLCALNSAHFVVTTQWLIDSLKQRKFVGHDNHGGCCPLQGGSSTVLCVHPLLQLLALPADEESYQLNDPESERMFGFSMCRTLSQRKQDSQPLFKDYVILVTPGVEPEYSMLKDVVESGGGMLVNKTKPTPGQITTMAQKGLKFLVISCANDLHLCKDYFLNKIGQFLECSSPIPMTLYHLHTPS